MGNVTKANLVDDAQQRTQQEWAPGPRRILKHGAGRGILQMQSGQDSEISNLQCFLVLDLSGHPKPANDGHLKTGQRE